MKSLILIGLLALTLSAEDNRETWITQSLEVVEHQFVEAKCSIDPYKTVYKKVPFRDEYVKVYELREGCKNVLGR